MVHERLYAGVAHSHGAAVALLHLADVCQERLHVVGQRRALEATHAEGEKPAHSGLRHLRQDEPRVAGVGPRRNAELDRVEEHRPVPLPGHLAHQELRDDPARPKLPPQLRPLDDLLARRGADAVRVARHEQHAQPLAPHALAALLLDQLPRLGLLLLPLGLAPLLELLPLPLELGLRLLPPASRGGPPLRLPLGGHLRLLRARLRRPSRGDEGRVLRRPGQAPLEEAPLLLQRPDARLQPLPLGRVLAQAGHDVLQPALLRPGA
mmetsp:Transcript_65995/g.151317  ORF Transcript_65995/g.151317 Transcript_65995/m.151317 type:complete len:265 (+) Transcript_65995:89-883(+)